MIFVIILALLMPAIALAQVARSPDFLAGYAIWPLDSGTASASPTTIGVYSAGIGWRVSPRASAQLRYGHAGEGRVDPGISTFEALVRLETPRRAEATGIFIAFGASVLKWRADNNAAVRRSCTPEIGCLFEGEPYNTGTEYNIPLSLGARIPLLRELALEPQVGVGLPVGGTGGRTEQTMHAQFGLAIAWRP
jgi:hypothetical protein